MVSEKEVLKKYKKEDLSAESQANLVILLEKVNKIRSLYGKPLTITSGYRSPDDQIRIYREIAEKKGKPFDIKKVPMGSQHLRCAAVDIYDPNKELQTWIKVHLKEMEEIGVWFEDFSATINWVHIQIYPPKSGNRFFIP